MIRFLIVVASLFCAGTAGAGEATTQAAGDDTTGELTLVPGREVSHWSGLPLWGEKEAREAGYELPLPLCISGNVFSAKQNFSAPKVTVGGPGGGLLNIGSLVQVSSVKVTETAWTARFEGWVLPFLSLYGIAGYVDGTADVYLGPAMPIVRRFAPNYDLRLNFDGPTLGLGGTVAGGFRPFKGRSTILFGLTDLNITRTFIDFKDVVASLDPVDVWVFSTRLGVRERILKTSRVGEVHLSVWGGAMYQGVQRDMSGRLGILPLNFHASVEADNPWNGIVGGRLELGKHAGLMIEAGIGDRRSIMAELEIRF